mmetsp:Transcript_3102/g.5009  ORF Transcript_3102/g.5009 Transcript_3102/m.5009 type:complete len:323 (-) Transcript_3102:442-1410(-)
MLAQNDAIVAVQANGAGINNLICQLVLEHAVLVDARLVCKRVGTHNGLVGLNHHACKSSHQLAAPVDLVQLDVGDGLVILDLTSQKRIVVALAHMQGHDNLLQGSIPSSLSDPIDGHLNLAGASLNGSQEVCYGHAEVIVAVHRDGNILNSLHIGPKVLNQIPELLWSCVANGVGDVDGSSSSLNGHRVQLSKEAPIGAEGVLSRKLYILHKAPGQSYHLLGDRQNLFPSLLELVLHVDITGCNKSMNSGELGALHSLGTSLNVVLRSPGQTTDDRRILQLAHCVRNGLDGLEVILRGNRESSLNDVHTQLGKLLGHLHLLL